MIPTLFFLLVGHALADFGLQSDWVAKHKARRILHRFEGYKDNPVWFWVMGAHSLIHGGAVALVTSLWWLGLAEALLHFAIDYGKCEEHYGFHFDQFLHVLLKVVWAVVWWLAVT